MRTYDYPHDDADSDPEDRSNPLVASSASLSVAKAVAATTALPAVVNSIQARLDGRDVSLMDGSLFATCPLHVAIDEARQLFPRRPLGVVLSIGYNDKEEALRDQIIQVARQVSPNLHFHRLAPSHIMADFNFSETRLESVVEMEEKVRDFIWADSEVSSALDITMKKLYSNQLPKPEYLRRQAMLQSGKFQERSRKRQNLVREILKRNSSQSRILSSKSSAGTSRRDIDLSLSLPTIEYENAVKDTIFFTTGKDSLWSTINHDGETLSITIPSALNTSTTKIENNAQIYLNTEEKAPQDGISGCPTSSASNVMSDVSFPSLIDEFQTITLKTNYFSPQDTTSTTEEKNARYHQTFCGKEGLATCLLWLMPCNGCNAINANTNEFDDGTIEVKAISMRRGEDTSMSVLSSSKKEYCGSSSSAEGSDSASC